MQWLVEDALATRHELEQAETQLVTQRRQAVAAAEQRVAANLAQIQGRSLDG